MTTTVTPQPLSVDELIAELNRQLAAITSAPVDQRMALLKGIATSATDAVKAEASVQSARTAKARQEWLDGVAASFRVALDGVLTESLAARWEQEGAANIRVFVDPITHQWQTDGILIKKLPAGVGMDVKTVKTVKNDGTPRSSTRPETYGTGDNAKTAEKFWAAVDKLGQPGDRVRITEVCRVETKKRIARGTITGKTESQAMGSVRYAQMGAYNRAMKRGEGPANPLEWVVLHIAE